MRASNSTSALRPTETTAAILAPALLILLWVGLTAGGLVKPLYLPGPGDLLRAVTDVVPDLPRHTFATFVRAFVGLVVGVAWGVGTGLLMGYNRIARSSLHGIIEAWRPVPPVALIPFFLLWFGFNPIGRILLVALGVGLIMVVATYEAVQNVPCQLREAALTLGARKRDVLWTVEWPAIRPELRGPLRVCMALSISLVIVSEFLGAQSGLGYLINVSKVTFSTHVILLAIILLGILSGMLDYLLRLLLRRVTPWLTTAT